MKNILIGVLMTTCVFLMMGTKSEPSAIERVLTNFSENGRYQAFVNEGYSYMLDTKTGKTYRRSWMKGKTDKRVYFWESENNKDDKIIFFKWE